MVERYSKSDCILALYERLCTGKLVQKEEEAQRFHVNRRSIQRDIDDIRSFLADCTGGGRAAGGAGCHFVLGVLLLP